MEPGSECAECRGTAAAQWLHPLERRSNTGEATVCLRTHQQGGAAHFHTSCDAQILKTSA